MDAQCDKPGCTELATKITGDFGGTLVCDPHVSWGRGEPCDAQYGRNPDLCYRTASHDGPHWNRWGTTWAHA